MIIEKALAAMTFENNLIKQSSTPTDLPALIGKLTNIISIIAGVLAFAFLVYSGFLYLTANGNPDQAKKGQSGIINAIIGLVIIALAYWIVRAVTGSIGGIS